MLGHYLLALTTTQEDRVLTSQLAPGHYAQSSNNQRCLVGAARDYHHDVWRCPRSGLTGWPVDEGLQAAGRLGAPFRCIEDEYDALCKRFTVPRVNAAIRDRILTNRLWRSCQAQPLLEVAHG